MMANVRRFSIWEVTRAGERGWAPAGETSGAGPPRERDERGWAPRERDERGWAPAGERRAGLGPRGRETSGAGPPRERDERGWAPAGERRAGLGPAGEPGLYGASSLPGHSRAPRNATSWETSSSLSFLSTILG